MRAFIRLTIALFNVIFVNSNKGTGTNIDHNDHRHGIMSKITQLHSSSRDRSLADISMRCQKELLTLQNSKEFEVEFPQLTEGEFQQHCTSSVKGISCDLQNTDLISQYRSICEDGAGGSTVRINMVADGVCVGNIKVEFWNFPICTGRSCDADRFVDSYREKLHTETDFIVGDCRVDLSLASTSSGTRIVLANTFILALVGTATAILSL